MGFGFSSHVYGLDAAIESLTQAVALREAAVRTRILRFLEVRLRVRRLCPRIRTRPIHGG